MDQSSSTQAKITTIRLYTGLNHCHLSPHMHRMLFKPRNIEMKEPFLGNIIIQLEELIMTETISPSNYFHFHAIISLCYAFPPCRALVG